MDHEVAERLKEMHQHFREHYASKAEMAAEFGKVHVAIANLHTEIIAVDSKIAISVSKLETHMHKLEARLIRWFVGTAIAIAGVTFAIARYVT